MNPIVATDRLGRFGAAPRRQASNDTAKFLMWLEDGSIVGVERLHPRSAYKEDLGINRYAQTLGGRLSRRKKRNTCSVIE